MAEEANALGIFQSHATESFSSTLAEEPAFSSASAMTDFLTVEAAEASGIVRAVDAAPLAVGSAVRVGTFDYSGSANASAFFEENRLNAMALEASFIEYGAFTIGDAVSGAPPFFTQSGSFKVSFEGQFNITSAPIFIWIVDQPSFPSDYFAGLGMGIFSGTGSRFGSTGTLENPQLQASTAVNSLTLNMADFDLAYVGTRSNNDAQLAAIPEALHSTLLAGLAVLAAGFWRRRKLAQRRECNRFL